MSNKKLPPPFESVDAKIAKTYSGERYRRESELYTSSNGSTFFKFAPETKCTTLEGARHYLIRKNTGNTLPSLDYISVAPGAGKTNWAINQILSNLKNKNKILIYCSPTIDLLKQTFANVLTKAKKDNINMDNLFITYSGVNAEPAFSAYTNIQKHVPRDASRVSSVVSILDAAVHYAETGFCLFLTHMALFKLNKKDLKKCTLIFDEVLDLQTKERVFTLDGKSIGMLHAMCKFEIYPRTGVKRNKLDSFKGENYRKLFKDYMRVRIDTDTLDIAKQYLSLPKSLVDKDIQDIVRSLMDDKFAVYVRDEMQLHAAEEDALKKYDFSFINFTTPEMFFSRFGNVVFLAAHFETSFMYHLLLKTYKMNCINHVIDKEHLERIIKGYKNLEIVSMFPANRTLSKDALRNTFYLKPEVTKFYAKFAEKMLEDLCANNRVGDLTREDKELLKLSRYILTGCEHKVSQEFENSFNRVFAKNVAISDKRYETYTQLRDGGMTALYVYLQRQISNYLNYRAIGDAEQNLEPFIASGKPLITTNNNKMLLTRDYQQDAESFGDDDLYDKAVETYAEKIAKVSLFRIIPEFERIRPKSHGLNCYKDRNVFISMAALNPTSRLRTFFNFLFDGDSVTTNITTYSIIQGLTRTKLRVVGNKDKVMLFTFSEKEAIAIHRLMPKSTLSRMPLDLDNLYIGYKPLFHREITKIKNMDEVVKVEKKKAESKRVATKVIEYRKDKVFKRAEGLISNINDKLKVRHTWLNGKGNVGIDKDFILKEIETLEKEKLVWLETLRERRAIISEKLKKAKSE